MGSVISKWKPERNFDHDEIEISESKFRTRISCRESKRKQSMRWDWESVFNGRHVDNEGDSCSFSHDPLAIGKKGEGQRRKVRSSSPAFMRRQNILTLRNTNPHSDQAINRKPTRMSWILQVDGVILPCIWITNQKRWCPWRQMPFPICWGWRTDQQEVEERLQGVYAVGLCVLRLLFVKVYSTWTWKIGIKSHRQMLQRHMAPNQNSGKKGSIAKIQKSAPLERSFLRAESRGKISWGDFAPRKMRPQFSVVYGENIQKLKNSDKITINIFGDVKGMPALTISKRPDERAFAVDSTRMLLRVGQRSTATIDPQMGNVFSARQTVSCLLSFQAYLSVLETVRLLQRYHRNRWNQMHTSPLESGLHQVHLRIRS